MINILFRKDPEAFDPPPQFLTLPISRYDLLDACGRLQIGAPNDALVRFVSDKKIPNIITALRNLEKHNFSFDELNFLAARLEAMTPDERFLMDGLACIHKPENLKDLINMTYNLDNVMVAGDIKSPYQLGKFLVDNDFWDFPESVIPYLDFAKIGTEHLAENACAIVGNVYFEDNRSPDEIKEVYVTFPEPPKSGHVFSLRLRNPHHDADDSLFVDLTLPASDEEITDALEFIGVPHPTAAIIVNFESRIADFAGLADENTDFDLLNDLADQIERMDDAEYIKYKAVLEHEGTIPIRQDNGVTLQQLVASSYQLDQYTLKPNLTSATGSYGYVSHNAPEQSLVPEIESGPEHSPQMGGM